MRNTAQVLTSWLIAGICAACASGTGLEKTDYGKVSDYLVPLAECAPSIIQEMRYAGTNNFTGRIVDGYTEAVCLLTPPAARALARIQVEARAYDLGLKVYDCYRPQRAVDRFVRWAEDVDDQATKSRFYPALDKARLFEQGYIAARSSHSRGSTVDITLVQAAGGELDMGTTFDYFDPLAHTDSTDVSPVARRNRLLLKLLMEKHGFDNYPQEWWHYTLRNEPWTDRYFDFPVDPVNGGRDAWR
jgi:D-alanyl-D-alanine dipeptidase